MRVRLKDKDFELYIPRTRIDQEVSRLAAEMKEAGIGDRTVFVGVLKGAFMFFSDLMKHMPAGSRQEFVFARSYAGTQSTGRVEMQGLNTLALEGCDVILVEDIVDSGLTANYLAGQFQETGALRVRICAFLFKSEVYRGLREIDFVGIHIPNYFVVGYGLDYEEEGRCLPDIYRLLS
ncbi:MAG: phosphoribosyltransferase family protein [Flavobacteriales bacterium]|nr:phosphoribosyltransferase family protein [Flavobacteriales bacterium]MCX7768098.1 phosphoribosyltransferase family protein [Flavobacteriales bacterium]MDW8409609.1 phosphoribosyltransferase family protein [Flavobacteriales bacterium]